MCVRVACSFQRLVFTTAAKMFSSTYRVMVEGEGDVVGYLNPLLALATTINVSLPGRQPDLRSVYEDARLLDSRLADKSGEACLAGWLDGWMRRARRVCCCQPSCSAGAVPPPAAAFGGHGGLQTRAHARASCLHR